MSTTDRCEVFRGQCFCGLGEIIIQHCEPDHPWVRASQGWFEATMSCENCRGKYELLEQEGKYVVVNKSDIIAQTEVCSEWRNRTDNLMAWPEVQDLLKQLEITLSSQQSRAAIYRLLCKYSLLLESLESIATFRKNWHNALDWIKKNVRASKLVCVMNLLNKNNEKICQELRELEKLWKECHKPLPIVGNPIYNTSPYQGN